MYQKLPWGKYSGLWLHVSLVLSFHFIAEGEGRGDPFSSLFKYKKTMPKEIFYDFACQLSEYALNRESELFKNTRFWHDLFHALGHLCGWNFKSGRVIGLDNINTEICEQVNSFLQCIKYTGSHLSQEHFVFFLQFFLCIQKIHSAREYAMMGAVMLKCHQFVQSLWALYRLVVSSTT